MAKWQMDNFPFIPEKFQYKVKAARKIEIRLIVVRKTAKYNPFFTF